MRIRISELRKLIRQVLSESGLTATAVDPTNLDTSPKGFYPYEIERGVDLQSRWYKSPGASAGSDGDPGRPSDAAEYIGTKPKAPTTPAGDAATEKK
jgi:hypothetical protein